MRLKCLYCMLVIIFQLASVPQTSLTKKVADRISGNEATLDVSESVVFRVSRSLIQIDVDFPFCTLRKDVLKIDLSRLNKGRRFDVTALYEATWLGNRLLLFRQLNNKLLQTLYEHQHIPRDCDSSTLKIRFHGAFFLAYGTLDTYLQQIPKVEDQEQSQQGNGFLIKMLSIVGGIGFAWFLLLAAGIYYLYKRMKSRQRARGNAYSSTEGAIRLTQIQDQQDRTPSAPPGQAGYDLPPSYADIQANDGHLPTFVEIQSNYDPACINSNAMSKDK